MEKRHDDQPPQRYPRTQTSRSVNIQPQPGEKVSRGHLGFPKTKKKRLKEMLAKLASPKRRESYLTPPIPPVGGGKRKKRVRQGGISTSTSGPKIDAKRPLYEEIESKRGASITKKGKRKGVVQKIRPKRAGRPSQKKQHKKT